MHSAPMEALIAADTRGGNSAAPQNPPESVANVRVRHAALWVYLGPVVALFAIVGALLLYWMAKPSRHLDPREAQMRGMSGESAPGGHNPDRRHGSTRDELRDRGVIGTSSLPEPPSAPTSGPRAIDHQP